ncbi:GNAT family N-acetyltransferase [Muricauda sp. JGD-17]|uniref:GNAT family N-acetyltransferase n=1 Tax=Flagellimonas ochracea TaxID=2696472 RepID=A0A964TD30_9FLAO|nr:GNAT family N-acetyltransferase [Allomuricauda ochracea]NAY91926.1 GNAT family N-acetyltransferase [Allomuricauda ochracea]
MDLIGANINNLTNLWKIGGRLAGQYIEEKGYCLSIAESGDWPNKLWVNNPLDRQVLADIPNSYINKLALPVWGNDLSKQELVLKTYGFDEELTQVAMSIKLQDTTAHMERIVIQKVTDEQMAKIWSQLFQEAFGYRISADTVKKTMRNIEYFIGRDNKVPVGTAMLFIDKYQIAGIHSMGIIPSQRRKGYAQELLVHMLNIASAKGAKHAILQASKMGKRLYLKAGFQEDFTIKTFIKHEN